MAASPSIFLLFIVLLAEIAVATSYGVHGSAGFGFEAGVANEQQSDNNDAHSERGFGFPYSGIFFRSDNKVNTESGASAGNQSENNNDGHSESRFSFPSGAGIVFHGGYRANSEADTNEHQSGPNEQSHEHHHHNQHNQSSYNDTEGERKFHWPSSVSISISRSNVQNPESGAIADYLTGPNRLSHEDPQYHHTHSAYNNDTDDEKKFRWPSSVGITITRSNEQKSESGAGTDYFKGQSGPNYEHHHHHNHSAHNNDTDGERKFRWPSSVGITITRSNKPNSDEDDEAKFFGLIPYIIPCNHTEQAGRSCSDCTHTLLCLANDIGIQRNCSPLYCNQGRCAVEPSGECSPAT